MIPLIGFAPDADQTTPGLLSNCTNLVPALIGMEGAPSGIAPAGVPVLAANCKGATVVYKLDNSRRMFAGTQTKLYELIAGAWTDRSRASNYSAGADSRWSFAQFGDATLACTGAEKVQRSTTGVFADIATAPQAEILFSVGAFVMALNTNDGAIKPDGWHCCAAFDDTVWTPSITTQAASGRLVATPGRLTAGARLGEYAIAYKERSIYLGQYVGAPVVWDWMQVAGGSAGCVGKNALCDIGGVHFFVGHDNFWLFDGTRPTPIGDGAIRQWFVNNASKEYLYKTVCTYDRENGRVWIFYPSSGATECNAAVVYHVQSKQWGRADRPIQCALTYVSSGLTYDSLGTLSATYDAFPDIGWGSQFWNAASSSLAIFDSGNQLQSLSGLSASSSMTTGEAGDDEAVMLLQQIRLRYGQAPASASVQTYYMPNSGGTYMDGVSGAMNDGKFDTLKAARWHKAAINFVGPVRITHLNAKMKPVGNR
jgi:hypothetical protein